MKPSPSLYFAAATLVLLAGAYALVIRPANQKCQALRRDITERQTALASLDRSTASIQAASYRLDALRPGVARFNSRLGSAREMDKVLEDVWHLAEMNALQSKTVKTPPEKRTDSYREQEMELSLAGDFGGFYQFLLKLEDMKRITRIKKMKLTRINTRDGQVQADLTLSVFFEPGA